MDQPGPDEYMYKQNNKSLSFFLWFMWKDEKLLPWNLMDFVIWMYDSDVSI
jgi:hypothetical protein